MRNQEKNNEEILKDYKELEQEYNSLKALYEEECSERKMIKDTLSLMAERNWAHKEGDFFTSLAHYISETLLADYIFISRVHDGKIARTLANYRLGEILPNFDYFLKGTPCENVYDKKIISYTENIRQEFPLDYILVDLEAESYSGIPLWDSTGTPVGLIALINRRPLKNVQKVEALLQLVADHTGQEIERMEAENKLRASEEKYRNIFESVQDVFYQADLSGTLLNISPSIKNLAEFNSDELIGNSVFNLYDNPDDREILLKAIKENGELKDFELKLKAKNGAIKYVSINARLIFDADNKPKQINGAIRDITKRKLIEADLKRSEQRFKQVAESAGEWIWEVDANGLYTYSSPVVEKILGYTAKEIIGKKYFYEFFHTVNAEETKNKALQIFASKQSINELINQNVHKDGTLVWLSTCGSPIVDCNGELLGYQGVDTDITERKLSEETLKESEFFFKESQKAAFIGSYKTDFINGWESSEVLDQIFGIDKDYDRSIPGWLHIIHPADREMMNNYLTDEVIAKHKPFNKEYRIIRINDKQTRWVLGHGITEFDDKGNALSMVGTIQDITERRLDDYKIKTLNYAVEATSEVVFTTDINGVFTYINPAFSAVYGYQADDVIGEATPRILKGGEINASEYESFWRDLLNNNVVIGEFINKTKDGKIIYVESSSNAIINEVGELIGFIAIQKDITKRKQIDKELILSKEKAEESDRLKSAFLANMSHEIRTPMNGILGFSELLKEPTLSDDKLQEYINTIQISGHRLLNTINSIIDVSKIESGLINVNVYETNINDNIEFIYKFFKPQTDHKSLSLSFHNGLPSKESAIKTDKEKVFGVITNLVQNAIKFTNKGSIEFGYEKKGNMLEFFVKDTGIGIQKNKHEIIFKRFRQASESNSRGYEGSGLGLSICKSYVEMLDGKIRVESEEGKGSTFYFTIPYNTVSEQKIEIKEAVTDEHTEFPFGNLKILIVEDDQISYALLKTLLQKISKEILHAITGLEAIEACQKNPDIDLVLMDIRMPFMNGLEATSQIRQFNKDVVIIAQTSFAQSSNREKYMAIGCNDYISKPIKNDKLLTLIHKHFNK